MEREETLNDFLKALRIVLNNAYAYPKDHPYFIKSVENFKQTIARVFAVLNPITVAFSPTSLSFAGRIWDKTILYTELAQIFHSRKIKSLQLTEGLTAEELVGFLSKISLPVRDILRQGGMHKLLLGENMDHINIEELDYSQFLGSEGLESKDIWVYLLKGALENNDQKEIKEFADNFEKIVGKLKLSDIFEDDEMRDSLRKFLIYLKGGEKDKFYQCSRMVFKLSLEYNDLLHGGNLEKMKGLFDGFDENDFAGLLWGEILKNENFDLLNLKLFSMLTGEDKERKIASALLDKKQERELLKRTPAVIKKIRNLLSLPEAQAISELYRHTLSSLLEDISLDKTLTFDQHSLRLNYRYIILNLLKEERDKERLGLVSERLSQELEGVFKDRDFKYLRCLSGVLTEKKKEDPSSVYFLGEPAKRIAQFVEEAVWQDDGLNQDLAYLVDNLEKVSGNADLYIQRIFREGRLNPWALKILLKFFPADLDAIYRSLERRYADIEFLAAFIDTVAKINSPFSMRILENIFSFANEIIKIEVLRAMRMMPSIDAGFLLPLLERSGTNIKKEALLVLWKDENAKQEALGMMFSLPDPWGRRNRTVFENMLIVEELDLRDAGGYLTALSKKRFFWNRNIRKKAREILRRWDVGKG